MDKWRLITISNILIFSYKMATVISRLTVNGNYNNKAFIKHLELLEIQ